MKIKDNEEAFRSTSSQINFPMSVLLTCPHGGIVKLSPPRKRSNLPSHCNPNQFTKDSDLRTIELTESIALNLFSLCGRDIQRKIALVHRSFVDFNRDPECAFESSNDHLAEHIYNEYHNGILKIIKKMYAQDNQGLRFLFDFHGTAETEAEIFFGTDHTNPDGSTICGLLELNPNALWDDTGLIKLLQDKGYSTCPQVMNDPELPTLDGGTTVKKYGGCNINRRLEAIQCEVTSSIRKDDHKREQFARDMAECIFKFVSPYVSQS